MAVGAQREQIKRWFWCSAFSHAYEKSPNTQSGRDVGELIPWLSDPEAPAPENVRQFRFNPEQLRDVTPRQRDCVLNRCLIDSATNQRISCSAPPAYMAVLSSHLIPHEPDSRVWSDDYERFLQQRLERAAAAIEQVSSG